MSTARTLRILGIAAAHGAVYAGLGALDGVVGASILRDRGYENYDLAESAKTGAVGGASVGLLMGFYKEIVHLLDQLYVFLKRSEAERKAPHLYPNRHTLTAELAFSIPAMAIAGALGHVFLLKIAEMTLNQAIAALAVGAAVIAAPLVLLLCGALVCLPGMQECLLLSKLHNDERVSIGVEKGPPPIIPPLESIKLSSSADEKRPLVP